MKTISRLLKIVPAATGNPVSIITLFLILASGCKNSRTAAQDMSLVFHQIPYEENEVLGPGRGAEQWHDQYRVSLTSDTIRQKSYDKYYRFSWKDIETGDGIFDWSIFDREIIDAIQHRQKFGFGIMPAWPGGNSNLVVQGASLFYPLYLHEKMQSETVNDWISPLSRMWVPNWNSESYLSSLERLNAAINQHLDTGSFHNIPFKNVINYIDIRGYGSYGEWHSHEIVEEMPDYPSGTRATASSLIRIIDAHVKKFTNYPLVIMFNAFDGNRLNNTKIPTEVAYHALTTKNNWGLIGWRRDNWGALDDYIRQYTDRNRITFNEMRFDTAIMNRYKYAPVNGEPIPVGSSYDGCDYGDMENQVRRYHASMFGNGNYSEDHDPCMQKNIRSASKAAGYRLVMEGGDLADTIQPGKSFIISLLWKNTGIAPTYENWDVMYELRNKEGLAQWTGKSSFNPRLFLPESSATLVKDEFALPSLTRQGNYDLYILIRDPNNYRDPLPLAIRGRQADGSYMIGSVVIAGNDQPLNKKM